MKTQVACFYNTGIPEDVIRLETWNLPDLGPNDVRVQMLYAPVNPADINILQGRYNHQPSLPAVGGSEGVGVVVKIGSAVTECEDGDIVISPRTRGRWCTEFVVHEGELIVLPRQIDPKQAAMLIVNAATAYKLLTGFKTLRPGDWIIQNASNSGVGRNLIQLARYFGYHSMNMVRRDELIDELKYIGANEVINEESANGLQKLKDIGRLGSTQLSLGLNAVGGRSALEMARTLCQDGVLVTYGAMSKEPMTVENRLLIFKNLTFTGFSMRNFYQNASILEIRSVLETVAKLMAQGILHVRIDDVFELNDIKRALLSAQLPKRKGKILIKL